MKGKGRMCDRKRREVFKRHEGRKGNDLHNVLIDVYGMNARDGVAESQIERRKFEQIGRVPVIAVLMLTGVVIISYMPGSWLTTVLATPPQKIFFTEDVREAFGFLFSFLKLELC